MLWLVPAARSPFGRVALVLGPETLLAERAVAEVLARARAEVADLEVSEADASRLDRGRLAEIASPSLFAARRAAVLTGLADLPAELAEPVVALASDPSPDLVLVLVHGGGAKGKGTLDRLRRAGVDVVDCPAAKSWELPQFVQSETRRLGGRCEPDAAPFLVDAVGHDLRALASAVAQLLADAEGGTISVGLVRRYFGGKAEVTSFAVADAALAGRTGVAMEQLRWALSTGVAPVLVTSALAAGVRGLGKLLSADPGLREADLAREVGVPPWKIKSMRGQLRGWDQGGLATAMTVVAAADADIKGAAGDAAFALERAVLAVAGARRR